MNEMLKQFNLPRYIDGLSFADASKKIQSKFKDRTDPESINTEKEMLDRLKQMQEHVKAQQEAQEEPERSGGDLVAGSEGMPLDEEEITQEYNQEQGAEEDLMSQIQSAYGGNQYAYGGPGEEIPATKANITSKVVGLTGIGTSPTNENMDFDTKQIVRYQPGVTSGETGKSGFYLYSKNAGEPGFDPLRHREFVNQEEMMAVQRTPQWKAYMQGQSKMALGGDEEDLHSMPETAKQRFSPVIPANDQSISSSIMSLAKTASSVGADGEDKEETNDFEFGGDPSEYYQNNNPYFTTNPGQINPKVREEGINPQTASQLSSMSGYNPQSNPSPSMGPATSGISDGAGKAAEGSGPGIAGYAQMGATALELGQEAFGPTGVDTSGRVKVEGKKVGNAALAGAAKGASAGTALGPWGASAGAVIGGAAGFFGAKKQRKAAAIANRNATYADAAVNDNQFSMGGDINTFGGGGKEKELDNYLKPVGLKRTDSIYTGMTTLPIDLFNDKNISKEAKISDFKSGKIYNRFEISSLNDKQKRKLKSLEREDNGEDLKLSDNLDKLRYAPALGNMLQLSKLKKPEQETTGELSTRYKPQFTDESALANLVREETNATREAILNASEGSGASARANLLGTQLNSTKALSDAYMRSAEQNNAERRQEQSFNLGVDTTNLQQQNMAQDIRARNKGAYDTEKSRLMSAVATDLGFIGQEELYKKFPELMGADYDWKGKYRKRKEA